MEKRKDIKIEGILIDKEMKRESTRRIGEGRWPLRQALNGHIKENNNGHNKESLRAHTIKY